MKKFTICLLIVITFLFSLPSVYFIAQSQALNIEDTNVVYQLPYPGILPDHPLYIFKKARDNVLLFTTRDLTKKAQLYLLISDKHTAAALELAENGKESLAIEELFRAEDYFLKIPDILTEAKEQGVSASADFVSTLHQSNEKHREIINDVMKELTEGRVGTFQELLKKNQQAKQSLQSL